MAEDDVPGDGENRWPVIKTAGDLIREGIVPGSEDHLRQLAKRHGVGRKWGRAFVFTPEDIERLIDLLPRISEGSSLHRESDAHVSSDKVLARALALASQKKAKRKSRVTTPK